MEFYQAGRSDDGSFDDGIEAVLQRVLVDPEFVYRLEPEPAGLAAGKSYRISDLALASRLSFFLWSSVPDDQLLDLAAQGKLKDPAVLEQQVKRMLADPKADALVTNFTGQWLGVRSLQTSEPVVNLFPDFDDNLRAAYKREIELFFGSIVHEDRSILDLLTANYTFVNERLAKQYGIPNIYGPQFRRVTLPAELDMRRGLLGKGALLTVTSNAARTSPVARGKWFLQTFLGVSPPDPPPNVPVIKEKPVDSTGNAKAPTMRETMEAHHSSPTCASCHKIFEPIGLAMENFDPVGTWRTHDGDSPIDATGVLVDGTKMDGIAEPARHAGALFRSVRTRRDGEDAHLRAGPRRRVSGHADGALDRARIGSRQVQVLFARAGHRQEPRVPDEHETRGRDRSCGRNDRERRQAARNRRNRQCLSRRSTFPEERFCAAAASVLALPLARCDDSGRNGAGANRGPAEAPVRRLLCAATARRPAIGSPDRRRRSAPRFLSIGSLWNRL